jgi:hypothetical protein
MSMVVPVCGAFTVVRICLARVPQVGAARSPPQRWRDQDRRTRTTIAQATRQTSDRFETRRTGHIGVKLMTVMYYCVRVDGWMEDITWRGPDGRPAWAPWARWGRVRSIG